MGGLEIEIIWVIFVFVLFCQSGSGQDLVWKCSENGLICAYLGWEGGYFDCILLYFFFCGFVFVFVTNPNL